MSAVFRTLLSLAVMLVLVFVARGVPRTAADGELRVSVREVDTKQAASVQFLAKVVDQNGRPMPNLTPENFSLKVGEQTIPVTAVQTVTDAQVGISSLLVIDSSGSMVGAPLAAARAAAAQYIGALQPVDEVGVLAFANGVSVISEFTQDFAAVNGSLQNLRAVGNTALYDAVVEATTRIAARENARKVVIFLSDGEHFGPVATSREQALGAATNAHVPFYVIGLGPSIDAAFLQELAGSTDGVFFAAPSSSQLAALFEETANLLRSEYIITADFSNSGLSGDTTARFRAQVEAGNGEVSLTFALPVPPTAVPTAAPAEVIEPAAEKGSNTAVILLALLMVVLASGAGGFLFWRRRQEQLQEAAFETLPPVYGLAEDFNAAQPQRAPPAILRLESGDELLVNGTATLGVDEDCTYRLPLTRGEFGHGQLRIWFANNRYIIHDVAPRPRVRVNGRPVTWSFLGDGDEIEVRGVKLRFTTSPGVARLTSDV